VKKNTGFKLLYDELKITEAPTQTEIQTLRKIDPNDIRSSEFNK